MQYTLSKDADIDIYIFSGAAEMVKKISCPAGSVGGSAGLNKVKWDGTRDAGGTIGNGIYVATIVAKQEGKMLSKFKINVFD
jgi:flagellar hook assembly protein FlgD